MKSIFLASLLSLFFINTSLATEKRVPLFCRKGFWGWVLHAHYPVCIYPAKHPKVKGFPGLYVQEKPKSK
jgi:hypothetical protein